MLDYKFNIQTSNRGEINIPIANGRPVFVLGANGVGKSALMHRVYSQNFNHAKRILAHRQAWFPNNRVDMTVSEKKQHEASIKNSDQNINSRWRDNHSTTRAKISIFELINSENIRSRNIANAFDESNLNLAKEFSNKQAPIKAINELLNVANIPIVISLGIDELLFASKNGSEPYSIAELSDGERNALLLCADALTAVSNNLIIIDEPERHLHRSIITPLLSALFQKRDDCAFVVATHDVFLPIDHPGSSVLLLRGCNWGNKNMIPNWDIDLITASDQIPDTVKLDILGSKRKILFVEGEAQSLDKQIYQLLFPNVTVKPHGNCSQVEKAVEGIRNTESLHWINAYGLIDADDKTTEQLESLNERGIVALECYSVESLYYNLDIVKIIAEKYSKIRGEKENILYNNATSNIISEFQKNKSRLCARICEKYVRKIMMSELPDWKQIAGNDNFQPQTIPLKEILKKEEDKFDKLVAENNLNGLIARYPIRETGILTQIAKGIGLTRDQYEASVRQAIIDDGQVRVTCKKLLCKLDTLINS